MKTTKLVRGTKKVIARLNEIDDIMRDKVPDDFLNAIGAQAVKIAKETIMEADHTQKYGNLLANEVNYVQDGKNKITIYAPYKNQSKEMRNQMYFLEYGAGIESTQRKDYVNKLWFYKTTPYDKSREAKQGEVKEIINEAKNGGITSAVSVHWRKRNGKLVGLTNTSKPVRYMEAARRYIQREWKGELQDTVAQFVLGRKYYRVK